MIATPGGAAAVIIMPILNVVSGIKRKVSRRIRELSKR